MNGGVSMRNSCQIFFIVFCSMFCSVLHSNAQSSLLLTLSGNAVYTVVLDGNQKQVINNQVAYTELNSGKFPIKITERLENGMTKNVYSGYVSIAQNTEVIAIYQPQGLFTVFSSTSTLVSAIAVTESGVSTSGSIQKLCMSETTFQKIFLEVSNEVFDDKKTKVIVSLVENTALSSNQAIRLLELFTFDDKRLTCALEIIPFICDRENYWKAGDVFTFSSNKKALLNKLEE